MFNKIVDCNFWSFVIILSCWAKIGLSQKTVGDWCFLKNDDFGVCTIISECPAAIKLAHIGHRPVICSFRGTTPIICCGEGLNNELFTATSTTPKTYQNNRPTHRPNVTRTHEPYIATSSHVDRTQQHFRKPVPDAWSHLERQPIFDLQPTSEYEYTTRRTTTRRYEDTSTRQQTTRRYNNEGTREQTTRSYNNEGTRQHTTRRYNNEGTREQTTRRYNNEGTREQTTRRYESVGTREQTRRYNNEGTREQTTRRYEGEGTRQQTSRDDLNVGRGTSKYQKPTRPKQNENWPTYDNNRHTTTTTTTTTTLRAPVVAPVWSIEDHHYTQKPPIWTTPRPGYDHTTRRQQTTSTTERPQWHVNKRKLSELKCEEYSRQVTDYIQALPLLPDPEPVQIELNKCDYTAQELIVGGKKTSVGEFPHMAALGFETDSGEIAWGCGGTLISDYYVVTAAHCTTSNSGLPVVVRLGELNLKSDRDGAHPVDFAVANVIKHPEYRRPAKYNDIALIKLSRRVQFSQYIRPACLYHRDSLNSEKAVATGWGRIDFGDRQSDILLKVVLNIVDVNTCRRLYSSDITSLPYGIDRTMICAGELNGGKDTCQGDSGGPIQVTYKSNHCIFQIVGITSFGKLCGAKNAPGVYTRISSYVPWIEQVVWGHN